MPLEKVKKLVDAISQLEAVPSIQPVLASEPFANEDLKEIIPYCCSKKVPINIITNGILLDESWMDFLNKCLDRNSIISFSLDAVTQETYEKVRGNYSLAELEKKIDYLVNNRGNKGPRVTVNFVYEEDNYSEKELFLEKWKNRVDAVRINSVLDSHRQIPAVYKGNSEIEIKGKICPYLLETMVIDSGGEVRVCCLDVFEETYFGNVFEEGIMSIWNGERMERIREKHRCDQLQQSDFCYGCEEGYSIYKYDRIEETDEYLMKIADYGVYYNRKEK